MAPTRLHLLILGLALAIARPASAQDEAPARAPARAAPGPETPGLRATQVTLAIEKDGKYRKFRATVMGWKDDVLTVVTVAHGIAPDHEKKPAYLLLDGKVLEGTVVSVVQNPAYRANDGREIAGPDNAVARFRFKPADALAAEALEAIRPAPGLTTRSYPAPAGQTISARVVDQHGVEHAVKAGNYSNPRLLAWGPAYKPIHGDSGSGVFVLSNGADGQPRPILIGVVAGFDDKGGTASLVSKEMRWIAEELAR